MFYDWVHKLRLWLWRRQERMMERDSRPTGTGEGDWIGANVAASAGGSGTSGYVGLSSVCSPSGHASGSSCSSSDGGSSGGGGD